MKESIITASDMAQLCAFWITRTTLPRPVRRRAVEAGILHPGQPPMFTFQGSLFMHEHTPRSKWEPPKGNPQMEAYSKIPRRVSILTLAAAATVLGGGR
jgi:hypothetical protein